MKNYPSGDVVYGREEAVAKFGEDPGDGLYLLVKPEGLFFVVPPEGHVGEWVGRTGWLQEEGPAD